MTSLKFKKMHGLGNCFIVMDDRDNFVTKTINPANLALNVCNKNTGIGADGLILVRNSSESDFRMTIFNEDGSEAEMCGNGVRCFARFLLDEDITDKRNLKIETLAGTILTRLKDNAMVEVDMGPPTFKNNDITSIEAQDRTFRFVSMGNPHAVTFVDNYDFDWLAQGAKVEHHSFFPNQTNVEFVKIISKTEMDMKVWERGCGETMACGTGACAAVVAGVKTGRLKKDEITVHLPGGDLHIHWPGSGNVIMTGPVATTVSGVYYLE